LTYQKNNVPVKGTAPARCLENYQV
jgi:hypothetical protein